MNNCSHSVEELNLLSTYYQKCGIKIWWACETKLYTGRQEGEERKVNKDENVFLQLAKLYSNTGRTIVADNFLLLLKE